MPPSQAPIVNSPGQGRTVGVVGDIYRFLATGRDTAGSYATWEAVVPPGGGPPPHTHSREEESFYILEGEIRFQIGDQSLFATAGMFASMPKGCPHSFKNVSDRPARMLISVIPAGLEEMFFEVGHALEPGTQVAPAPSPGDIQKLLGVAGRYGIEIHLPAH